MSLYNWKTTLFDIIASKIRKIFKFKKIDLEQSDTFNEVLFYGAEDEDRRKELGLNNLFCIYYVLVHARQSIDICVPSLMSDTLTNCLVKVKQINNINIRLALHSNEIQDNIQDLRKCGIEVNLINSKIKLEHEFILIDAKEKDGLAIIGSLDYEVNNVNCNRDNTLLTSEPAVVLALTKEFDRVWSTLKKE